MALIPQFSSMQISAVLSVLTDIFKALVTPFFHPSKGGFLDPFHIINFINFSHSPEFLDLII